MEKDELKHIAPNLTKIKKEQKFSVPDGYFKSFRQRLDEKIHTEEKIPLINKVAQIVRPQLALAGLMTSVLVIVYFGIKFFVNEPKTGKLDEYVIAQVLEDEIYYMDESFILESLEIEKELSDISTEPSDELVNEIIDYLSEDGMSLDLILEDL